MNQNYLKAYNIRVLASLINETTNAETLATVARVIADFSMDKINVEQAKAQVLEVFAW
jgi:hypothetical protein